MHNHVIDRWSASTQPWQPVTDASQTRRALDVAMQVAQRQLYPDGAKPALSLGSGDCGTALLFGYLADCTEDPAWTAAAHEKLHAACASAEHRGPAAIGMFNGIAGVGFTAAMLSAQGRRYQRLLQSVDRTLYAELETLNRKGAAIQDFDVITGLAGIGVYVLQRTHEPAGLAAAQLITTLLIKGSGTGAVPQRWASTSDHRRGLLREIYPGGCLDCGVAHGVPGPLAFLSRARLQGIRVPNLDTAITDAVTWLLAHRVDDEFGSNWPLAVPIGDDTDRSMWRRSRAAWCYGAPGVARVLWLAGRAMNNADWCGVAVSAMTAVFRRPRSEWMVTSPGLCHGLSGLLQITLRFCHDTHDEVFLEQARSLTAELIERFDPDSVYGYVDARADDKDNPGFLDGAAGVAASLLAAAGNQTPVWDQVMLLA